MNLHENKELFAQFLIATADHMGLSSAGIVEKDYFVTLFLQKIVQRQPKLIFKGGTSLSKCYKLINRFSEDIDLSVDMEEANLTQGQRKQLKQDILDIINELGFQLENADQVRSRRDFNRYIIDYGSMDAYGYLKQHFIVETSVFIRSFPTKMMYASSFIYDFLSSVGAEHEIATYRLAPFALHVQTIERTFVDKVFAIADYSLDGHIETHSRHIYDLYKLYPHITFDSEFADLVREVRAVRKMHSTCLSARDGVDLPGLLRDIIAGHTFKSDYNQITSALLFDQVPYAEATTILQKILDNGWFG